MNKKVSEKPQILSQIAAIVSQIVAIVSQVVKKIKDEKFLFVIAIVALLVGLTLLNVNLGSPNTRFIIAIIAILTFTVISGHFVIDVLRMREQENTEKLMLQQVGHIGLWKCSKCGYMNRWENWSCNNCKHKWKEDEDSHIWLCKKCNEHNLWENDFCSRCGKHYMTPPAAYNSSDSEIIMKDGIILQEKPIKINRTENHTETNILRKKSHSDRLNPNDKLEIDDYLISEDGRYKLVLEKDGLGLYKDKISERRIIEGLQLVSHAIMQGNDGNFVIYGPNGALWQSNTDSNPGAWLIVQNDGQVVIYDIKGQSLWPIKSKQK